MFIDVRLAKAGSISPVNALEVKFLKSTTLTCKRRVKSRAKQGRGEQSRTEQNRVY